MMLATIGFQYVIQENVPKTPTITYLDSYVIVCLLLILFVVLGTPRLHPNPGLPARQSASEPARVQIFRHRKASRAAADRTRQRALDLAQLVFMVGGKQRLTRPDGLFCPQRRCW